MSNLYLLKNQYLDLRPVILISYSNRPYSHHIILVPSKVGYLTISNRNYISYRDYIKHKKKA